MNAKERDTVERAIVRAHAYGLQIAGHGMTKPDGLPCWAVTSRNSDSVLHIVTLVGERLTCTCVAYKHGSYCAHRGLVHEELVRAQQQLASMNGKEPVKATIPTESTFDPAWVIQQ